MHARFKNMIGLKLGNITIVIMCTFGEIALSLSPLSLGWGRVIGTGRFSTVLKNLPITILTDEQCQKKNALTQNMICGTNPNSPDDTSCQGDSGGPLVCQRSNGDWVLEGVISFGSADCEGTEVYPVFTKVSNYINWILKL